MPPERQLASLLGVGRSAIREALAALEILGVVTVRPGSGTYLRGSVSELLPQTLSWGILLGEQKTEELIGFRHGLEVQAARLAAVASTPESDERIAAHLAAMERTIDGAFADFVAADMHFHQELAATADNTLLAEMLQTVRSLIRVWIERALNEEDHAQLAYGEHAAILQRIRDRDPAAAAEAMNQHMHSAAARLRRSLPERREAGIATNFELRATP